MKPAKTRWAPKKLLRSVGISICAALIATVVGWAELSPAAQTSKMVSADLPELQAQTRNPLELVQIGKERYQAGQYAAAIALWQQAAQGFSSQGDRLNQAAVLSNLALAYQQLGQWQEANQAITESLNLLSNQSSAPKLLAQALNIQGSLQLSQGQAEQALTIWEKASAAYQKAGDPTGAIRSQINQTQALRALGLYPRAKITLEQVNKTLQDQPDSALKAAGFLNLGDALRLVGNLEQSQTVLKQSLAIAQKLQSPADITLAMLSLGNTARGLQQVEEAYGYYQQAIATSPTPHLTLQAQLNQLRLLVDLEKWTDARALAPKIQSLLEKLSPSRTTVYARVNLAQSLLKIQNGSNQTKAVEKTAANSDLLQDAAQLLATAAQQAKNLGDQRAEAYALGYLGEVYEQSRQIAEARSLTEKALILAQTSNAPDIAYRWQWQLGRLLNVQGKPEGAIAAYSEAVNTLGSIRNDLVSSSLDVQFSFRESVEPVYRELVALLLQPTKNQEVDQENLKKARQVIESLQLAELDNFFREACLNARPAEIDRVDPQAAVIYPIILPDRLEVVISLPNQPLRHYASAIPQNDLEVIVDKMRRSLRRSSFKEERLEIAQKVYDLLIRPAEPYLKTSDIKTLAFVLDGSMKNLPMAALYDGQQYLVEKYSLALTPGLQLLDPRPLQPKQLQVLVAGLTEARQGFSALPGVEDEVSQIKSGVPTQVLLNQTFTSAAMQQKVNATPFRVVHLATHGQFSSNAENTFVLTWDGRLDVKQLGELLQSREQGTRTPIELLVLSACQTAKGDKRAALGLAGVAVRSGARSTIASLWSVDDQSTSVFMTEFYRELAQAKATKAESLRQAQLKLLQQPEFEHPFFWAPFVLIGNWL